MTDEQKAKMDLALGARKAEIAAAPIKVVNEPVKKPGIEQREITQKDIAVAQKSVEALKSGKAAEVTKDSFNK